MDTPSRAEVTQLLGAWSQGDSRAFEQLLAIVHGELTRLARAHLRRERPGQLFQTTDLVNDAYLRLTDCKELQWENRAHFFAVAAQVMRRILVDYARARDAQKRGGGMHRIDLEEAAYLGNERATDFVGLDDALKTLAAFDARKSRIVELRFFGGLSEEEVAVVLKISVRTVRREWSVARAWLRRELSAVD